MTPHLTIAIDPGKRGLGWSAFGPAMEGNPPTDFLTAGLARLGKVRPPNLGGQAIYLASQVPGGFAEAVVEQMFQYPTHGRRDSVQRQDRVANDLLDLQAIGGIVAARCCSGDITYVTAHGWKGEMPDEVVKRRVEKILSEIELRKLSAALADVPEGLHHNMWESTALGLWKLKRWKR